MYICIHSKHVVSRVKKYINHVLKDCQLGHVNCVSTGCVYFT